MGNPYAPPEPGRPPPERRPGSPGPGDKGRGRAGSPRRPPEPAQARALSRTVTRFALLMLAGLLCLQLPVPWQAAGIVFTVLGLVTGVRAVRQALRAGMGGSLVVSLSLGLVMAGVLLLMQLALLAVWPAAFELQECRARALTVRAEEECRRDYERWIEERSRLPSVPGDDAG